MSMEIVNTTTVPVKISEGSGGVYFQMSLIQPGKTLSIRIMDKNATYREYILATEPENLPVGSPLTSDDFEEYSRIEIKETVICRGDPVWIGIPTVKRSGCMMFEPNALLIVNSLENLHVQIVGENEDPDRPIADLAPGAKFSLSVDPDRGYLLTTPLGRVFRAHNNTKEERAPGEWESSTDLTKFSQIEIITDSCKEYYWAVASPARSGRYCTHHTGNLGFLAKIFGMNREAGGAC